MDAPSGQKDGRALLEVLLGFARRIARSDAEAEDLAQDAYVRLRTTRAFKPGESRSLDEAAAAGRAEALREKFKAAGGQSAAELWSSLDEATTEAELAMPAQERRRQLAAAGVDVDRALAEANERVRTALSWRRAQEKSKRVRGLVASLSVAAALAASALVVLRVLDPTSGGDVVGAAPPRDAITRATALREAAVAACKARSWTVCGAKLDEATKLDPAGEREPAVQSMRQSVEEGKAR
jgi:DNA-directed RNA polymerase specialized sigma24 family protein